MGLPNIGPLELIIILAIALLIVGPGRLPEMGNAIGKTIREFRKASSDITDAAAAEPAAKPATPEQVAASTATPVEPAPAGPQPNALSDAAEPNVAKPSSTAAAPKPTTDGNADA